MGLWAGTGLGVDAARYPVKVIPPSFLPSQLLGTQGRPLAPQIPLLMAAGAGSPEWAP